MNNRLQDITLTAKQLIVNTFVIICYILVGNNVPAQDHHERFGSIDVIHYTFTINLSDETNEISCIAEVTIRFKKSMDQFYLDLVNQTPEGTGMMVSLVSENGTDVGFLHENNQLRIGVQKVQVGEIRTYLVEYSGTPANGLLISENMYGDRTYFGDNWPDRAHHWLPLVDHPSDKAYVEFLVKAPSHYQVIANGSLVEETRLKDNLMLTHWKTEVPLPTKIMVIGVAKFTIYNSGYWEGIPVSSWVYPQNADNGQTDFEITEPALDFFSSHIAPYPFTKLAHVQSTTIYGGTENAGNIFYHERLVNSNRNVDPIVVHEIAHQWFGNSASEMNWHHIWLSEGFATYFTDLFYEHHSGIETFRARMGKEREEVVSYSANHSSLVIDTTITDYMHGDLLSPITYEKAGWFLHMLRHKIGDDNFWSSIQDYYNTYRYGNALTEDLKAITERISGQDLDKFYHQWLHEPGHPQLLVTWSLINDHVKIRINQIQKEQFFSFPLDIQFQSSEDQTTTFTLEIEQAEHLFNLKTEFVLEKIIIDPDVWLLHEATIIKED